VRDIDRLGRLVRLPTLMATGYPVVSDFLARHGDREHDDARHMRVDRGRATSGGRRALVYPIIVSNVVAAAIGILLFVRWSMALPFLAIAIVDLPIAAIFLAALRAAPAEPDVRDELLEILVRRSYFREPGKQFRLASGRMSDYYIECSLTTTHGPAMRPDRRARPRSGPARRRRIGGPTMGADPIAAAVAYYSAGTRRPLSWFSVRKTAKEHGARRWLEGTAAPGDAVVVVEDVITSGGSVIDAVRKCTTKASASSTRRAGRSRGGRRPRASRARARRSRRRLRRDLHADGDRARLASRALI
jgi:orotate phosphoribosyltransferase